MNRKNIILQWFQVEAGLFVFDFGIHLTICANIGLAPWDCMSMGLSKRASMNFGTAVTIISLAVLAVDLLLKERIGFGTVLRSEGRAAGRTGKAPALHPHRLCGDPPVVNSAAGGMADGRTGGDRHRDQHFWCRRHHAGGVFPHKVRTERSETQGYP